MEPTSEHTSPPPRPEGPQGSGEPNSPESPQNKSDTLGPVDRPDQPEHERSDRRSLSRVRWRLKLLLPVIAVVGIIVLVSGSHETLTTSEVISRIHEIALAKPQGGLIGPWWVSASSHDPVSGKLKMLRVEWGDVRIAAKTARVVIDPVADTFRFDMWDVVMANIDVGEDTKGGRPLIDVDHYEFGPIPYGVDIVPDEPKTLLEELRE